MRLNLPTLSCLLILFAKMDAAVGQQAITWPLSLPVRPTLPLPAPSQGGYLVGWSLSSSGTTQTAALVPSAIPTTARYNIAKLVSGVSSGSSMGSYYIALSASGRVIVWSASTSSSWASSTYSSTEMVVPSAALSGISDIAIQSYMGSCVFALRQDGTLVAWDASTGTTVQLPTELQSGIVSVTTGGMGKILALKSSGAVVTGTISSSWTSPITYSFTMDTVPVNARSGVAKVFSGSPMGMYVYAIKESGQLISWDQQGTQRAMPSLANSDVVDAGDASEAYALLRSGRVIEWDSQGTIKTSTPSILNSNIAAVSSGGYGKMALTKDGALFSWDGQGNIQQVPYGLENGVVAVGTGGGAPSTLNWALTGLGKFIYWQSTGGTGVAPTALGVPGEVQGGIINVPIVSSNAGTSSLYFALVKEDQAVSAYCGLPLDILADLVARRIGLNPLNYGLAPKTYVDGVAGTAQARGVASVTQNPRTYSLYTQSEYQTSQAAGVNSVLASPNAWSLYTAGQIQDMSIGNPLLTKNSSGKFVLNYEIEQSDDLKTWVPYRVKAEELTGLPTDKAFVRIKAKQ
jgi:hypothetical protein